MTTHAYRRHERKQCYAEFLRTAAPKQLFPAEHKTLKRDQDWLRDNPAKAKRLEKYVGRMFRFGDRTVDVIIRWLDFLIVYDVSEGMHLCANPEQLGVEVGGESIHASSKQA